MAAPAKGNIFNLGNSQRHGGKSVNSEVTTYANRFEGGVESEEAKKERNDMTKTTNMVDNFYSVVTDFYEYGWGDCFHFGHTNPGESYAEAIRRHEYYLAYRLKVSPGAHLVDMGCGIGGPARNIARFSGAKITGVTINEYQVQRARTLTVQQGLEGLVNVVQGNFMQLPIADSSLDGAYAIEATCHTVDKVGVFGEAFRVLKPGAYFVGYEWVMTEKYNPKNEEHQRIRFNIEVGNGLPELQLASTIGDALRKVGFEEVDCHDFAVDCSYPWYTPLASSFSLKGMQHTRIGRTITSYLLWTLETLRLAPKGSLKVQQVLITGADGLVDGGRLGIFTPMYFFIGRKPL